MPTITETTPCSIFNATCESIKKISQLPSYLRDSFDNVRKSFCPLQEKMLKCNVSFPTKESVCAAMVSVYNYFVGLIWGPATDNQIQATSSQTSNPQEDKEIPIDNRVDETVAPVFNTSSTSPTSKSFSAAVSSTKLSDIKVEKSSEAKLNHITQNRTSVFRSVRRPTTKINSLKIETKYSSEESERSKSAFSDSQDPTINKAPKSPTKGGPVNLEAITNGKANLNSVTRPK